MAADYYEASTIKRIEGKPPVYINVTYGFTIVDGPSKTKSSYGPTDNYKTLVDWSFIPSEGRPIPPEWLTDEFVKTNFK